MRDSGVRYKIQVWNKVTLEFVDCMILSSLSREESVLDRFKSTVSASILDVLDFTKRKYFKRNVTVGSYSEWVLYERGLDNE